MVPFPRKVLLLVGLSLATSSSCVRETSPAGEGGDDDADETGEVEPPGPESCGLEDCGAWTSSLGQHMNSRYGYSDAGHYYAAAEEGLLHYDGERWEHVDLPGLDPDLNDQSIWAAGPSDVFVHDGSTVFHWDGTQLVDLDPTQSGETIRGISGSAHDDVWIGTSSTGGPVLHYDGETWTRHALPETASVDSVWAFGPTDVWASGTSGLWHYDGAQWTSFVVDGVDHYGGILFGTQPDDVWLPAHGGLLHWDGSQWSAVPTPHDVRSVWGPSPDVIYALAPDQKYTDQAVLRWDGTEFYSLEIQPLESWFPSQIHGVGTTPLITEEDHIYRVNGLSLSTWITYSSRVEVAFALDTSRALGFANDLGDYRAFFFEHGTWSVLPGFHFEGIPAGVAGESWDDLWVGGDGRYSPDPDDAGTHLYHFDGTSFERVHFPGESEFTGWNVHLLAGDLYVIGGRIEDGVIQAMRLRHGEWTDVSPAGDLRIGRTDASENVIFATTHDDGVFRFDGEQWSRVPGSGAELGRIAVTGDDSFYALTSGLEQALLHYDAGAWRELDVSDYTLKQIVGNGHEAWLDARLDHDDGTEQWVLMRLEDDACTEIDTAHLPHAYRDIHPTAAGDLVIKLRDDGYHSWWTHEACG